MRRQSIKQDAAALIKERSIGGTLSIMPVSASLEEDYLSSKIVDPFVAISIGKSLKETQPCKGESSTPKWINQLLEFKIENEQGANIEVWSLESGKKKSLVGQATVAIVLMKKSKEPSTMNISLKNQNQNAGNLKIEYNWQPDSFPGIESASKKGAGMRNKQEETPTLLKNKAAQKYSIANTEINDKVVGPFDMNKETEDIDKNIKPDRPNNSQKGNQSILIDSGSPKKGPIKITASGEDEQHLESLQEEGAKNYTLKVTSFLEEIEAKNHQSSPDNSDKYVDKISKENEKIRNVLKQLNEELTKMLKHQMSRVVVSSNSSARISVPSRKAVSKSIAGPNKRTIFDAGDTTSTVNTASTKDRSGRTELDLVSEEMRINQKVMERLDQEQKRLESRLDVVGLGYSIKLDFETENARKAIEKVRKEIAELRIKNKDQGKDLDLFENISGVPDTFQQSQEMLTEIKKQILRRKQIQDKIGKTEENYQNQVEKRRKKIEESYEKSIKIANENKLFADRTKEKHFDDKVSEVFKQEEVIKSLEESNQKILSKKKAENDDIKSAIKIRKEMLAQKEKELEESRILLEEARIKEENSRAIWEANSVRVTNNEFNLKGLRSPFLDENEDDNEFDKADFKDHKSQKSNKSKKDSKKHDLSGSFEKEQGKKKHEKKESSEENRKKKSSSKEKKPLSGKKSQKGEGKRSGEGKSSSSDSDREGKNSSRLKKSQSKQKTQDAELVYKSLKESDIMKSQENLREGKNDSAAKKSNSRHAEKRKNSEDDNLFDDDLLALSGKEWN